MHLGNKVEGEAKMESQMDRVNKELKGKKPDELKGYVLAKAEEFEKLREEYEQQINVLEDEVRTTDRDRT